MRKNKLTYKRVKELFRYENGVLTWRKDRAPKKEGDIVGTNSHGYLVVRIDNVLYGVHRVIFLYCNGYMPGNAIDHINRIKTDNRIENLREVSMQCNIRNSKLSKANTSGIKGVYFVKKRNRWYAKVKVNYKNCCMGGFVDFDEAVCARLALEQSLGWRGCESRSSAYLYVRKIQKKYNMSIKKS